MILMTIFLEDMKLDMTDEVMDSEEKIMLAGTVVCQEKEKKTF